LVSGHLTTGYLYPVVRHAVSAALRSGDLARDHGALAQVQMSPVQIFGAHEGERRTNLALFDRNHGALLAKVRGAAGSDQSAAALSWS